MCVCVCTRLEEVSHADSRRERLQQDDKSNQNFSKVPMKEPIMSELIIAGVEVELKEQQRHCQGKGGAGKILQLK